MTGLRAVNQPVGSAGGEAGAVPGPPGWPPELHEDVMFGRGQEEALKYDERRRSPERGGNPGPEPQSRDMRGNSC